ncbi:MAG: hypothetical protein RBU37_14650 [Myxococcota bacterium]|jgi:hypothetical protein|nr:hypothetical protein [Myxococcota bacterium]
MPQLVAVDLGLRVGVAAFEQPGELLWAMTQHLSKRKQMERLAWAVFRRCGAVRHVVVEGDPRLGVIWERLAQREGASYLCVSAELWRPAMLLERERRSGSQAKRVAERMANALSRGPDKLSHDAAEAVLLGLWACAQVQWMGDGTT